MDDEAGPPSLFVVAYHGPYYGKRDPPYVNILRLDTPELPTEVDTPEVDTPEVDERIRFNKEREDRRRPIRWLISPPKSSTENLYMVPNWGFRNFKPLQCCKFNLRAGMCKPITPPLSSEWAVKEGHVVNLGGGRIYLLGYYWDNDKHSFFQCYDPDQNSWKSLEPFPHDRATLGPFVATAVLGDTILFNLAYSNIWAYDVSKNKWYEVGVEDKGCYYMEGETVTVGDTIYALTDEAFNLVLALSIEKKPNDGDLVLKCSSENLVPGMIPINYQDAWDQGTWRRTRHLVHLGKNNFCLVQSCNYYSHSRGGQDIKLSYIKLKGKNSMILAERIHKVDWHVVEQFDVVGCFSLPKGATTALKEGEIFNLETVPEAVEEEEYEDNDASETNINEELLEWNWDKALRSGSFGLIQTVGEEEDEEDNDSSQTNIIDEQPALGSSSFWLSETDWSNTEEMEQSWASELKVQKDNGGGNESQPIGDPSEAESSENEEVDKLITLFMSLKYKVDQLTCALEKKTQAEMQLKSTYDMFEQMKSSFSAREAELESELQQSILQIEQLEANLMDIETKLQGIWEEKEELNGELASKGEPDYETDKLRAEFLDKETELRRVKEELEQCKKDEEDAKGRIVSKGSKYGPRSLGNTLRCRGC